MGLFLFFSFFLIGATGSLFLRQNNAVSNLWSGLFGILGSLFGIVFSASLWITHQTLTVTALQPAFSSFSFSFTLDGLSLVFVFLICLITLFCSLFGIGYAKHFFGKYSIGLLGFLFHTFILGMLFVVTANNALFFLFAWELMAITSFFLIIYEHREPKNIRAGFIYLIMAHLGTATLVSAFFLLYAKTGSFDFATLRSLSETVPPVFKDIAFVLLLIGLGTKSGVIPFHIWLPEAHPAAPSHISAILSGVMIKTGIYMMIRMFVDVLGPVPPLWWGLAILIAGSFSALLGVLYALTEHNLKKLLAYHSIENIGIILLGLGSALVFLALKMPSLALIGLVAALFHTINHAIFKSLLFLGAGAVITKTHTDNMEAYGGLIKVMPYTAIFFLIGSMAISALPPLNGFFSEWMIFQSLFEGIARLDNFPRWIYILSAGSLAFTGGLALACFVKAFGITFLARPRNKKAKNAEEVSLPLRLGMGALATLALFFGLFSTQTISALSALGSTLSPFQGVTLHELPASSPVLLATTLPSGLSITFILLASLAILSVFLYGGPSRKQKVTLGKTWDCGTDLTPRMEITATGFSRSVITIFRGLLKPSLQNRVEYNDAHSRYIPKSHTVTLHTNDISQKYLYTPVNAFLFFLSRTAKRIQTGNINSYVLYIFLALFLTLLFTLF